VVDRLTAHVQDEWITLVGVTTLVTLRCLVFHPKASVPLTLICGAEVHPVTILQQSLACIGVTVFDHL